MEPAAVQDIAQKVGSGEVFSGVASGGIAGAIAFYALRIIDRVVAKRKKTESTPAPRREKEAERVTYLTEKDVENMILKHQSTCLASLREEMRKSFEDVVSRVDTGMRGVHERLDTLFLAKLEGGKK